MEIDVDVGLHLSVDFGWYESPFATVVSSKRTKGVMVGEVKRSECDTMLVA